MGDYMKYRALFLIKLGYYLEGKKITLNPEIYSLFIKFSLECSFFEELIKIIEKMMVLKGKKLATALTFFALCIIHYLPELILSNFHIAYILLALCTFLSIIFINEYNGKQGFKLKYILYIFYPLHLLLLYFIF